MYTVPNLASVRVCYGNQEVRRRLPVRWFISHVDEILPRLVRWTKVDHSTFVDQANLVEHLIKRLSCLINRNYGGHPE